MLSNPLPENRSKIHLLFIGLAGLTLVAFALSFALFHRLASTHEQGVQLNRELAERVARFDRLETLVTDLDAPGNDFSLTGNVPRELRRIADAGKAFRKEARQLREMLKNDGNRGPSLASLDASLSAATRVETLANEVIATLSRRDLPAATGLVADLGQTHLKVMDLLQGAEDALRDEEMLSLTRQTQEFARIGLQERGIGIALLFLTSAIVLYGRPLVREIFTARDREAYVKQLQEREASLEAVIHERDEQTKSLEEAQSIAGLGSWDWDVAADRIRWSQELHRIFGTRPESTVISYESFLARVHPDDRVRMDMAVRMAMESSQPFEIEHRIIRTDGAVIILDSRGDVRRDRSGRVTRMFGIAHDITARRNSEVDLQRSEERFQLASRATNDGIWDRDLAANTLWINEGWAKLFDRPSAGEIDVATWKKAIHSEDRIRLLASIQARLAANESSWTEEYRIETPAGSRRSVLDRCFVVRDSDGKPLRMIGAMMDITGRKEAEEAIARLHRQTALILETAADGLFGMDTNGVSTFVNPAAAHILGYEPHELLGKQMHAIIHPRREDGTPYAWTDCIAYKTLCEGGGRSDTGVFSSKSGQSVPVDYSASAMVDETGQITGAVMTFRDISERQAVDRMKSEFVSTVSHELRTPLTSIRGALGLLATGRLGTLPEKGARLLEIASTNTDRLVRLINDILDIERMESGKVTLAAVSTNAADLVQQAVDITRQLAEQSGIAITVDSAPAPLVADPDRIVQTLTNLIGNAIKFSPARSTIHVRTETMEGNVVFRVADQGRGIPADKLESIFGRFKQVDASDSRDKGGSGLGLAISRSIVRQHGGEISVRSEVGVGSEFSFSIPGAPASTAPSFPRAVVSPERLVFICDDEQQVREGMKSLLIAHGYRVAEFADGTALIEASRNDQPALILLDILLPGLDGWETLDKLKSDPRTAKIPVVAVNVLSSEECRPPHDDRCGWLHNPLEQGDLLNAVTEALRSSFRPRRMLIVEDDADLARVIASSFERHGLEVIVASTGQEAIDIAGILVPDLVVLDLLLPEVDGFGVIDWIKDHDLWQGVPLIVYSALETTPSQRERLRLGPTEFITKSRIGPQEFEQRVLRLLDRLTESSPPALRLVRSGLEVEAIQLPNALP